MSGWIGVDLDGTLAEYHGWMGVEHIGEPIEPMLSRVKAWLARGEDVRIFTARVSATGRRDLALVNSVIADWCEKHVGRALPVTNVKDFGMICLYDDRAVTVEQNTGKLLAPEQPRFTP